MKPFIFFALVLIFVFQSLIAGKSYDYPNYVVIGAFASRDNAMKFTGQAVKSNFDAHFDVNPNRNLYYVFVMVTDDRPKAIAEATRLRKVTSYFDAWVYQGAIGDNHVIGESGGNSDVNPLSGEVIEVIGETQAVYTASNEEASPPSPDVIRGTGSSDPAGMAVAAAERPTRRALSEAMTREELAGRNFIFEVTRGVDGASMDVEIEMIDPQRSRKIGSYRANEPVVVTVPQGNNANVSFACALMGYRKLQKDFDFNSPAGQGIMEDEEGNIVVPFELVRLQKGDIAVMYNVFFYKDAAVMRPESRYEVTHLLTMLNENHQYRIKLHGHTNGKAHGRIISMGETRNFFSLTGSTNGTGSAKKLSEERAKTIQEYLMSHGISEERIEIKAWGGKRPIHDKDGARAQENVRVEVEILND